ncbi:Mitoferrin like [Actinidia chinensis var. chinensis]|uniref:Mitoferrin like n=1 Tax=Actinidia chinensis var. chinensis TaxID=1590841 RepID=A0A2R6QN59_ACTCC|nr:Mitoferrin like [Actinidia chinensis var. chinensis]
MDPSAASTTDGGDNPHNGPRFLKYMLAGSVAGMVEHMAMFPVDTLKTRMQMVGASPSCAASPPLPFGRFIASIVRSEGPMGLYRGIGAMGLGAGPAHAVYFSVYELCKQSFGGNGPGHHPLAHAAAGVVATTASDAVLTPMDVVKQRLQLPRSPYGGVRDCAARMFREEGVRAFYASYKTTVVMNAPFTAVHFSTYEAMKKVLGEVSPENASEERVLVHLTAGGAAGALASAVTTPLDVVKTRLQCQGVCGADKFSNGSIHIALRQIVAKEGPQALLQGLKPRVLFHTPAAAICWSTYEAMKNFLHHFQE